MPGVTISEEDFTKIEKAMRYEIKCNHKFEQSHKAVDEAIYWAESAGQPYKVELLNDLKRAGSTSAET